MSTMSALIQQALGQEDVEVYEETVSVEKTASAAQPHSSGGKLSSVLRYIGSHGIEKVAQADMPENNASHRLAPHMQSQVGHNPNSGDMGDDGALMPGNNAGVRHSGPADLQSMGHGTHHPSLASNDAAINYSKREKSKHVSGQLKHLLARSVPFADPKVRENMDNDAVDPNINSAGEGLSSGLRKRLAAKKRS